MVQIIENILIAMNEDLMLIEMVRGMFGEVIPANVILGDFKLLREFEINELIEILKIAVNTYLDFGDMGYVSCRTLARFNIQEYIVNQL